MRVAALYVDPLRGPYTRIAGVDVYGWAEVKQAAFWDRDARQYAGPWPVVAHPPCGPWGRFRRRYKGGEGAADCGPRAVEQVRQWGGVLEHPAYSTLWDVCNLPRPGDGVDNYGGVTVQFEQVRWGHPCKKPTWFYVVRADLPAVPPQGRPTHCMVRLKRNSHTLPELPKRARHLTPPALANWLVAVARGVS